MKYILGVLLIAVGSVGCKENAAAKYPKLDLLKYGLPISIAAPAEAEVEKSDYGVMSDVTVKSGDDYYVQIFSSDATTMDAAKIKGDLLTETKAGLYFSKIVEEHENGFIFEKQIGERVNYDFRVVKLQGDKEYIFQTGLVGTFTEEQVRTMYEAVQ